MPGTVPRLGLEGVVKFHWYIKWLEKLASNNTIPGVLLSFWSYI